jgi:phage shock protein A
MTKKKRNHPTVEDVLARPWCYYCERDFDDQKILIDHQKAKHFKCDHCNRRLNTAGGLFVHLQQVHKATLTVIDNAMEGRQNVEPEIFGMMGIPEELVEAHRQRVTTAFFEEEANRRAQTGNPPPGQGQPNAKRPRVDESLSELKARAAEYRAKRQAERQAEKEGNVVQKNSSDTPDPTRPSANPSASVSRLLPRKQENFLTNTSHQDFMAPPPQTSHDYSYYERPQQLPQFAPYPGLPLQSPQGPAYPPSFPVQQPGQWTSHMRPNSFSPPQAAPYTTPSFMPPVRPPVTVQMPSMATPNHNDRYSPTITRQPAILQPAPGLPARPSFDSPSFNRQDMQRMHSGQAPPPANIAGPSRSATKSRKLTAHEQEMEDLEKMLKDTKDEFLQSEASKAAANATQDAANSVPDTLRQSAEDLLNDVKNEVLQKRASAAAANATQDVADPVPAPQTMTVGEILADAKRRYLEKLASVAAANGTQVLDTDTQISPVEMMRRMSQAPENGSTLVPVVPLAATPTAGPPVRPKRLSILAYDHHDESPEQKKAKRSKYAFQRNDA